MTIVVYGMLTNRQCLRTIKALRNKGIKHTRRPIEELTDPSADKSLAGTHQPVVFTDDDNWTGWRPDKINQLAA